MERLSRLLPRSLRWSLKRIWYLGRARRCPVCASSLRSFAPHGDPPRPNAYCPICRSVERHRLAWICFQERTDLLRGAGKRLLHLAPELGIEARLRDREGLQYVSLDIESPLAGLRGDATALPLASGVFDAVYCSHVLEHIPEDRQVLAEFFRVLKPGGWALLDVPITGDLTFEDPQVSDPVDRKRLFGQHDHVRAYGRDFAERVGAEGFDVKTLPAESIVARGLWTRLGLADEPLFFCTKPL